jgi:hypothetical protein
MDGQRTEPLGERWVQWVQNMAHVALGGAAPIPGLGRSHWRRATGAGRLPGNRRCGDGAARTRTALDNAF